MRARRARSVCQLNTPWMRPKGLRGAGHEPRAAVPGERTGSDGRASAAALAQAYLPSPYQPAL